MDLHPAFQRKLKTFPDAAPLQAFFCLGVAGIAEKQGDDVTAHMVLIGVNQLGSPVIGQLQALFVAFHGEMGAGEEVDEFVVVRRPELGPLYQDVFHPVDVKKGGRNQRFLAFHPFYIVICGVRVQKACEKSLPIHWHLLPPVSILYLMCNICFI